MSTTSPFEYERRIHALERMNAALAAEIDKMRPVVEMAQKACEPSLIHASLLPLLEAVNRYKSTKDQ